MKTRLRILEGTGSQWDLTPGSYRIDSSNADIEVPGWTVSGCVLKLSESGSATIDLASKQDDSGAVASDDGIVEIHLQDFVPIRVGSVAICTGPLCTWPSDAELLATLLPVRAETSIRGARASASTFAVLAATIGGIAVLLLLYLHLRGGLMSAEAGAMPNTSVRNTVDLARQLRAEGLSVTEVNGTMTVHGVVATRQDDRRLRQLVESSAIADVNLKYDVAENDIAVMKSLPPLSNASIRYLGDGRISVVVPSSEVGPSTAAVNDLRNDFSSNIKDITVAASASDTMAVSAAAPSSISETAAMEGGDPELVDAGYIAYRVKPDGTKEIIHMSQDTRTSRHRNSIKITKQQQ